MARDWEIRGLFGNEYALETAVEELKKHEGVQCQVLDRRNLSVRLKGRDESLEGIIRRAIEIAHGYVESEAPLGEFERTKQRLREKKLREFEEKKRRSAKH
ncbi:MAG: hypothetical protein E6K95_02775 [Thaumarchaeota archaeon]|nr:MAG: hypothetical protein E6K95_02775 [Nitrososphaerota archaeon]TLY17626.1 MAG: hypothetical protein E6K86_01360 [Nitrososphaerota archaeon]TMQ00083.1 MAG: hypothetical protein E6K99_03435 [Nitrososphaerota archaeon]